MLIRRPGTLIAVLLLLVSCGSGSLGAPAVPDGGEVAGRLVSQTSDGSHRAAEPGLRVGAFKTAFSAGPVLQDPPQPVTTAVTSGAGLFLLSGLASGRYFIAAVQPGPSMTGTWVHVTADAGASVLLVVCTDCPVPLNGSSSS
jgi:hypothetical protein